MKNECCVCLNNKPLIGQTHNHCPANHEVCKDCFIKMLKICFCRSKQGNIVYTCPICRNEHHFNNKEVYKLLNELNEGDTVLYVTPHSICQTRFGIPNFIRKCKFEKCGCRHQSKDLEISPNVLESMERLIEMHMV